ncbi:M1 family metallopeptidase [Candidatus Uhrbacteria bacterium]|nr:M1 family metallopeptidase [Candidatus Uhrbacteria bacterium]
MADEPVRGDPHSHYVPGQPKMTNVEWWVEVNFKQHVLKCRAHIQFDAAGETTLDLRDISILSFEDENFEQLHYTQLPSHSVLGGGIQFVVPESREIWIWYSTSPNASGLQWLTPEQTSGKRHPFMFTQGQCLHTRSFLPCQDTPEVRFTFSAKITILKELRAVMGAHLIGRFEGGSKEAMSAVDEWIMRQPIPAYLVSLAVGELEARDITDRCRVYAEHEMVEAAANEFKDIGRVMGVAERLAGPYEWERFDMLVLPPSFPYGGMENPRLAFLSPTIVVGDCSMTYVVWHELAHSWTGNLITNSNWGDFWLNEGWTTWFEWRLLEALFGEDEVSLHIAVQYRDLYRDLKRLTESGKGAWTKLRVALTCDDDLDDVFSHVPYSKGAHFIRELELAVGRESFDKFVRRYIERFRFTSISTQKFLDFVAEELPGALDRVGFTDWVDGIGMPGNTSLIISEKARVAMADAEYEVVPIETRSWSPLQWVLYLQSLSRNVPASYGKQLEQFGLAHIPNIEVRWSYLLLCLEIGYRDEIIQQEVESLLTTVGRMKYILPLYRAAVKCPEWLDWAREVFDRARSGYHPIAVAQIERIFKEVV